MTLEAHYLTAERNERCLFTDLNFTLNSGEILQVVGANGAGKTTLLRIISGLLPAVEGEVSWCGKRIEHCRETYFSDLIYIGHQTGAKGGLTPRENLRFAGQLAGQALDMSAIDVALDTVGLRGMEDTETHMLSAGQQRRVSLARLALISARLWILDEPLAALDTSGVEIVERLISRHLGQQGMLLMTSHQPLHFDTSSSPRLLVLDT
jgi:heme exporter protein A